VFQVQPHQKAGNRLKREGWTIEPAMPRREYLDSFENRCQRLEIPVGSLTLRYEAVVEVGDAPDDVGTAQVRGSSA
jgi:hypothetical protein